jgi:hypothetical protein
MIVRSSKGEVLRDDLVDHFEFLTALVLVSAGLSLKRESY